MTAIRFGTSGWRGIIGREFTFDRVEKVIDAIAAFLLAEDRPAAGLHYQPTVCVGGDTRFLSPELSAMAAERLASRGFLALLSDRPVPTPVLSHAVRKIGARAAVNFTASHNPALYNGIKFSPFHGGPAGKDVTDAIERHAAGGAGQEDDAGPASGAKGRVETRDFIPAYLEDLGALIGWDRIRRCPPRVVYDPFYGTGRGVLDASLRRHGCAVRTIHDRRDPLFGGKRPEPCEEGLRQLSEEVVRSGASVGLSTDGDADRFGIVDETGAFVQPHDYLPLLLEYLVLEKGWRGLVVRSLSTGSLMDRVARAHDLPVLETPVGFKYLGAAMLEQDVVLAGEESGGMSVLGHVPEKDGILACLLAAEMVSARGKGLRAQLEGDLWPTYGRLHNLRMDVDLEDDTMSLLMERLVRAEPRELAGLPVLSVDRRDGVKLYLEPEDTWVLVRLSGTEPLARLFFQAADTGTLDRLVDSVTSMISVKQDGKR
ncbi:hypothetical protein JW921_11640 [Candidatus Fermentibacterales bacterium]|nr:hypothetical protein [Candidatus Fermentibacterales bacterium]